MLSIVDADTVFRNLRRVRLAPMPTIMTILPCDTHEQYLGSTGTSGSQLPVCPCRKDIKPFYRRKGAGAGLVSHHVRSWPTADESMCYDMSATGKS